MARNHGIQYRDESGHSKAYYYRLTFFLGLVLSALIFLPFVLKDRGYFIYYGDFNVQQIPFFRHGVDMVHHGDLRWDWYTDLGSNFSGDYAFYMTTSPFFWIMCLFPSSWAPYLMAPMYTLKFAVAALCAYAYLKRFVKKPLLAVAGALMYAFSGFQIYNIFFNHFHDSVAFFPLLLLGIEELIQNDRRGFFAFAVFVCGSVNYFFFVGEAVFCVLYFLFRCSTLSFRITFKKFMLLALEAVTGVLMSLVFLLPAVLSILSNNRLDREFHSLKDAFLWTRAGGKKLYTKRYGHIFQSLFFPPDIPSRPEFFGGKDLDSFAQTHTARWASNAAWVPMFGMAGALTYIWNRRKSWLSHFILFLTVCALVPVLNSLFFAGNSSYYARWMFMLVLMLVLATVISLDKSNIRWTAGIILSAVFSFLILLTPVITWKENDGVWSTTRSSFPERIVISAAITFLCLILTYVLVRYFRGRKHFEKLLLYCLSAVILIYAVIHVSTGKQHCSDSSVRYFIDNCVETSVTMKKSNSEPRPDNIDGAPIDNVNEEFYRMDQFNHDGKRSHIDNYGIFWKLPSIQCFNSTVPSAILDFYPKVGVTRNVASRPEDKYYGLRGLLSVKYCFVEKSNVGNFSMQGFTKDPVSRQNRKSDGSYRFSIYENEHFLPMGFTYEAFMKQSEFEKIAKNDRHVYLCSFLVVPDGEADFYSKLLPEVKKSDIEAPTFELYTGAVNDRLNGSRCQNFVFNSDGFKADISTDKRQMVFFSVPYDIHEFAGIPMGGWSATVNGQKTKIHKVLYGFMAVEVPSGENIKIKFEYRTPGRLIGLICTIAGVAVLVLYLLILRSKKKKVRDSSSFAEDYYEDFGYPGFTEDSSFIKTAGKLFKKGEHSEKRNGDSSVADESEPSQAEQRNSDESNGGDEE